MMSHFFFYILLQVAFGYVACEKQVSKDTSLFWVLIFHLFAMPSWALVLAKPEQVPQLLSPLSFSPLHYNLVPCRQK